MRFWDTSAVVPLLLEQSSSEFARANLAADGQLLVWWGTSVEIESALARFARERPKEEDVLSEAQIRFTALAGSWFEVQPSLDVKGRARNLLRRYPLRAADSLQLAAALVASGNGGSPIPFVCADARLGAAAQREGLPVLFPGT